MDFRIPESAEAFRAEARAWAQANVTDEHREHEHRTGDGHNWELHRKLAEKGWIVPHWPVEYGGQGRDPYEMDVLTEELKRAGYPDIGLGTTRLVGASVLLLGTEEQKRDWIPRIQSGEMSISLGYSEPESGSDVFAAKTKAVRDGDEWVIDGQKMFTTTAHLSTHVFLLCRTDPDVAKHKGLTMFVVDLASEGIEKQPVHTMSNERTNVVFYSGVRVPDANRVGDVNGGVRVMSAALQMEQGGGYGRAIQKLHDAVADWARTAERDGAPVLADVDVRTRLARAAMVAQVGSVLQARVMWMRTTGQTEVAEGPMAKLYSTEEFIHRSSDLCDLLGSSGVLAAESGEAPAGGIGELDHRYAQGTTIYAGSSEVMRSIIAEHHLGLPRSRG